MAVPTWPTFYRVNFIPSTAGLRRGRGSPIIPGGAASGTAPHRWRAVRELSNQLDGNLVLHRADGTVIWSTGTWGNGPSTLRMQNDGNLVLYRDSDHVPLWASGTCCR